MTVTDLEIINIDNIRIEETSRALVKLRNIYNTIMKS